MPQSISRKSGVIRKDVVQVCYIKASCIYVCKERSSPLGYKTPISE